MMNPIKILSWDCAYKTLGWAIITVKPDVLVENQRLKKMADDALGKKDYVRAYEVARRREELLRTWFVVEDLGVDDILHDRVKDTSDVDKARAVHSYLQERNLKGFNLVLIELQPSALSDLQSKVTNNKSSVMSHQLIYHFLDQNPQVISPRKKTKVCLAPHLEFKVFSQGVNDHNTRKKHSEASIKHVAWNIMSSTAMASWLSLSAAIRNNAADAVMQVFAYLQDPKTTLLIQIKIKKTNGGRSVRSAVEAPNYNPA